MLYPAVKFTKVLTILICIWCNRIAYTKLTLIKFGRIVRRASNWQLIRSLLLLSASLCFFAATSLDSVFDFGFALAEYPLEENRLLLEVPLVKKFLPIVVEYVVAL